MNIFKKRWDFLLSLGGMIGQGLAFSKVYFYHVLILLSLPSFIKNFDGSVLKKYWPVIVFIGWTFLSLLWTASVSKGLIDIGQILVGAYILFYRPKEKELEKSIVIASWINLFISVLEGLALFRYPYSEYSDLRPFLLRGVNEFSGVDMPTGLCWNPNNNALFVLVFAPIVMSLQSLRWNFLYYLASTFVVYKTSSKLILVGWFLFTIVLVFRWFQTLSKKNLLKALSAIIISLSLTAYLFDFNPKLHRHTKYAQIIPVLTIYVAELPVIFVKRMSGESVSFDYHLKDRSLHERLTNLDGIFKLIRDHFWFGVGAGGLEAIHHSQGGIQTKITTPHFYFIEIFAKFGFFAFMLYLGTLLVLFCRLFKKHPSVSFSLLLFMIFNPVVSSVSYFLPKWVLYSFAASKVEEKGVNAPES